MSPPAQRVAALAVWMGVWWLSAAVPLEVTALLPLALLPLLGVGGIERAAAPYANSVIFLFLGGFFVAASMQRWGLHRRIALAILRLVGTGARQVVFAFALATAFMSMWISNTAAAVMMLPMALAVITVSRPVVGSEQGAGGEAQPAEAPDDHGDPAGVRHLGTCLALAVGYGASIGGVATLIGTPPNAIFAAAARELYGAEIGFGTWMATGIPLAALLLLACWWLLVDRLYPVSGPIPGLSERLAEEGRRLGPLRGAERFTFWVFVAAALAWVFREPKALGAVTLPGLATWVPALSDTGIAVLAALLLFAVPITRERGQFALDWGTASRVPWGILLLFGGGLSLADAFQESGLSRWIGELIQGVAGQPRLLVVAAVALTFTALTEFTSNTAVAAMAMPLLAGVAEGLGQPPLVLMHVAALASSMAFLLPVSTPPNAVVFSSGHVTVGQMAKAGIWLDLVAVAAITVMGTWIL
jgi:sodium-dependent dicarboxylate transporter 2/3/5